MILEQQRGPVLGRRGEDCYVLPATFSQEICATPESVRRNIEATLARKYQPFNGYLASPHLGTISLVGSSPSLVDHYEKVTGDVMACNAAHDFLIERGIVPKFGMMFDADPICQKFMRPHPDVTYLLASRCHPEVFVHFEGANVVVWHAMGDTCIDEALEAQDVMEPIINGGSAAVVRGMGLAVAMGYKTMHLFGVDSSCRDGETHIKKSLVPEKELEIFCHERWFVTTPWLANQAEDFKILGPAFRDAGCEIIVHGNGLIPHIAKVLGFQVFGET